MTTSVAMLLQKDSMFDSMTDDLQMLCADSAAEESTGHIISYWTLLVIFKFWKFLHSDSLAHPIYCSKIPKRQH